MIKSEQNHIKYEDLGKLLNYIFPDIDDWVHNKMIPNLIINGKKIRLRPAYRSEKLKLIILYDYSLDIPNSIDTTIYSIILEDNEHIYRKAGYRVVAIPSHLSFSKIKEEFDKREYTYIKNNRTEKKFRSTPIVNETKIDTDTIHLGNTVKVLDIDFNEKLEYTLVETSEIDILENKISIESPIGKALLGKRINQEIEVNVSDGIIKLKILEII